MKQISKSQQEEERRKFDSALRYVSRCLPDYERLCFSEAVAWFDRNPGERVKVDFSGRGVERNYNSLNSSLRGLFDRGLLEIKSLKDDEKIRLEECFEVIFDAYYASSYQGRELEE